MEVSQKKKKIFFSASIRFAKINFFTKKIINCLQKAIYISVRESYVKKILKKLNIYANETLDPTLLVNKKLWLSLAKKSKIKLNKKYLLIYDLENNSNLQKYAYEISNKFNYEVVTILGYPKITKIFSNNVYQSIKPEDFCNFFLNAKFILTSSYHGLIFSIIFKKKFYINANKLNSFRILNLLNKFNLKKRFITKTNQINLIDKISFNLISKIILTEQQKTNKFLREVLK